MVSRGAGGINCECFPGDRFDKVGGVGGDERGELGAEFAVFAGGGDLVTTYVGIGRVMVMEGVWGGRTVSIS